MQCGVSVLVLFVDATFCGDENPGYSGVAVAGGCVQRGVTVLNKNKSVLY